MRLQPSSIEPKQIPAKTAAPFKQVKPPAEKMQSAMAMKLQDLFKK